MHFRMSIYFELIPLIFSWLHCLCFLCFQVCNSSLCPDYLSLFEDTDAKSTAFSTSDINKDIECNIVILSSYLSTVMFLKYNDLYKRIKWGSLVIAPGDCLSFWAFISPGCVIFWITQSVIIALIIDFSSYLL